VTLTFSRVTLSAPLLTLEDAKRQLGITDSAHDELVAQKLKAAEEGILAYLGTGGDPTWTTATAPEEVKDAILGLLTSYYEHRGDDFGSSNLAEAVIWRELAHKLRFYRDPTVG
jgi:hypothetical protein